VPQALIGNCGCLLGYLDWSPHPTTSVWQQSQGQQKEEEEKVFSVINIIYMFVYSLWCGISANVIFKYC
jgi:hypothetical protein